MAKFMNDELIAIRDSLCCGHCESVFKGSDSQAWKVKYEKQTVYCCATCRAAALRNKFRVSTNNRGPCLTCKKEFYSKTAKFYCCMDCYIKSDQFAETTEKARLLSLLPEAREKMAATNRKGTITPCLECGEEIYQKLSNPRKFCDSSCYRSFMAKRFDRWVANPEGLSLPQCYDEFLEKEVLPCFIDGCGWAGQHLTLHMNQAHGVPASDFKRAAGFNLGTGVVAKPLAQSLRERPLRGVAAPDALGRWLPMEQGQFGPYVRYVSLEGREHRKKSRALAGNGPTRICIRCSVEFQQKSPFGRALYCNRDCRDSAYAEVRRNNSTPRIRDSSGRFITKNAPTA